MNPIYQQPYGWGYNPMMLQAQQQKLAELEQQYPQFGQQNPSPQTNFQPQMNGMNQNFVKCRAVTSIDEAKASMIDLDGSINVFTDIGNKKIYTKQINLDGTASLKTYILQEEQPHQAHPVENTEPVPNYVRQDELEAICRGFNKQINELREDLEFYESLLEERSKEPEKPKSSTKQAGGKK